MKNAKENSIGVFAGGGAYNVLKDLKFSDVLLYPVKTEEQNLEMLIQKKHTFWVAQESKEKYIVSHSSNREKNTIKKLMFIKSIDLWVATSKQTAETDVNFLKSLFNDFKKTEQYKKIIDRFKS